MLTRDDVIDRAEQTLRWYAANGTLHVRSHVDITDRTWWRSMRCWRSATGPRRHGLQLVAFPQEGICSFPTARN